jgi:hypothetical protein
MFNAEQQGIRRALNHLIGFTKNRMDQALNEVTTGGSSLDVRQRKQSYYRSLDLGIAVAALLQQYGLVAELLAQRVAIQYDLGGLLEVTRQAKHFKRLAAWAGDLECFSRFVAIQAMAALHMEQRPFVLAALQEVERLRSCFALGLPQEGTIMLEFLAKQLSQAGAATSGSWLPSIDRDDWDIDDNLKEPALDMIAKAGLIPHVDAVLIQCLYKVKVPKQDPRKGETVDHGGQRSDASDGGVGSKKPWWKFW